jgi:hypothetical protein
MPLPVGNAVGLTDVGFFANSASSSFAGCTSPRKLFAPGSDRLFPNTAAASRGFASASHKKNPHLFSFSSLGS